MQSGIRHISIWTTSLVGALLFNLFLFCILPALLQRDIEGRTHHKEFQTVNFYKAKLPRPPKKKKPRVKIPEQLKTVTQRPNLLRRLPVKNIPLTYELDPRITGGPSLPPSPPMVNYDFSNFSFTGEFEIGEIDGPLIPVVKIPPPYPFRARRMGIEGSVRIEFLVNEKGNVEKLKILDANPPNIFEQSVKRTVLSWRFKPGTLEGEPVKVRAMTTIRFSLDK
ncbi:MAG: energy transducer TonB [Deltaproteobacteria bacterium]|nr:energy transducer TonB [Deltaproteobacteria bacterium]